MIPDSEERALSSYHISFPTGSPKASKTGIIVNVLYNPMSPVESFFSVAQSPSLAPSFRVSGNSRTWDLLVCTECIEHLKVGRLSPWWWSLSQSPEQEFLSFSDRVYVMGPLVVVVVTLGRSSVEPPAIDRSLDFGLDLVDFRTVSPSILNTEI